MARILQAITVVACLSLILAGCEDQEAGVERTEEGRLVLGQAAVEATDTRGVDPSGRTLVIDGLSGAVRLNGTDAQVARLTFTKRARGRNDEAAREVLSGIRIEESGAEETYTYTITSEEPARSRVDVAGDVPRGTRLRIQLESGSVALSGITGPIQVEHTSGNVRIAGASEPVTVETRNGMIEVGLRRLPPNEEVRLRTRNGDIRLAVPAAASARVEAATSAGAIRVEGLSFDSRQLEPLDAGHRFTGRLGQGATLISLQTENGTITLHEGTLPALPSADSLEGAPHDTLRRDTARIPLIPPDTTDTTSIF